jgi:hypothetical protein
VVARYASVRQPGQVPRRAALRLGLSALGVLGFGAAGAAFAEVVAPAVGAAPAPTRVEPDGRAVIAARAKSRLDEFVDAAGGQMSVAAFDRVSGLRLTSGSRRFNTASIVKIDILATLLLQRSQQGQSLTAGERKLATSMVTVI